MMKLTELRLGRVCAGPLRGGPRQEHQRQGVTLIELMMALAVLAITFTALSTALVYLYRSGHRHKHKIYAMELAFSAVEEIKGMNFDAFGENPDPDNPPDNPDPIANPVIQVYSDLSNDDTGITYEVERRFRGYGEVDTAGATTLRANFTRGQDDFVPGEFVGHFVMITGPVHPAQGQVREITANTADTLTISPAWDVNPPVGARFLIDGGKTVEVNVRWSMFGTNHVDTITAIVIPRGGVAD